MRSNPFSSILAPLAACLVVLTLTACGGGKQPSGEADTASAPAGPPPTPTIEQLRAAAVSGVFEQSVTLAGGRYEGSPVEAGAASRPGLMLWEPAVRFGDVDGSAGSEAVALLSATTGGSGEFVHLAVFGVRDGALANLGTAPVGDRTKVQSMWLEQGKIIMDVVEIGPADAACCPTQVARKTFGLEGGALKQLTSEVRGVLALSMLAANEWTLVEMDGQPLPAGVDPPLIHFERESVRGFAGCNRFNASVKETKPGEIEIAPAAGTRKACPPPAMELEDKFFGQLAKVRGYTFLAGQLALTWQDGDRFGTLLFRK
jgi:heat shock protein HslJ